jgi:hypothetical protein
MPSNELAAFNASFWSNAGRPAEGLQDCPMFFADSARIGVQEYVEHARMKLSSRECRRAVVGHRRSKRRSIKVSVGPGPTWTGHSTSIAGIAAIAFNFAQYYISRCLLTEVGHRPQHPGKEEGQ